MRCPPVLNSRRWRLVRDQLEMAKCRTNRRRVDEGRRATPSAPALLGVLAARIFEQCNPLGASTARRSWRREPRARSCSICSGAVTPTLRLVVAAALLRPYDPKQGRLPRYDALIRSSRRPTKRSNRTTRTALAIIQIHLNQPWKISVTSPPG